MFNEIAAATSSTDGSAAMKKATGVNKDDFLKLFMTQMQNQDPLNPQDGSQFISQLAQLTQVEQSYNTNTNLANILSAVQGTSIHSLVSFIGKQIQATGNRVSLSEGAQPLLTFNLPSAAAALKVEIRDAGGRVVRTIGAGGAGSGDGSVQWDGKSDSGQPLPAGEYSFAVTGSKQDGGIFTANTYTRGTVGGVRYDNGKAVLICGSLEIPIADVLSVRGAS